MEDKWTICKHCKVIQTCTDKQCFFCLRKHDGPEGTLQEMTELWEAEYSDEEV